MNSMKINCFNSTFWSTEYLIDINGQLSKLSFGETHHDIKTKEYLVILKLKKKIVIAYLKEFQIKTFRDIQSSKYNF